ncbi:MAG: ribosome small subunit-dependent GTPase A, partial [Cyanobacteria bacterium]|nr:ribosome small subunit-dependent GTPase A [Cyanobacteriota bacterium]
MLPQLPTSTSAHPMGSGTLLPKVLKYHSNFYYVEAEGVLYECFVKGILKKEGIEILVGDAVVLDNLDPDSGQGRIVEVLERTNVLTRPKIANIHQAIIVHPLEEPAFSPAQLDRYLTHVELAGLDPIICISKCDLAKNQEQLEEIKDLYHAKLGYPILFTSVHHPNSLAPLVEMTRGKVSVLAGLSGAGKSSLLNFLKPSLKLKTQEVSEKISRGQHTTRHVELIEIAEATYIADTPGFS